MADYTTYWLPEQVRNNLGQPVRHIADNQLHDAQPGDTLWVVNVRDGLLYLVSRICPTEVCDQATARKRLNYSPWKAKYHLLCPQDRAERSRLIPVGEETWNLTFESEASPRLTPKRGKVRAQQVRRPRKLTPQGAAILKRVWERSGNAAVVDASAITRASLPDVDDGLPMSGREGEKQWRRHLKRERNRRIVERKKIQVKADTGRLRCEACRFDFDDAFGLSDFIEVHHNVPLSDRDGVRDTKLQDLSVLCANCHRAIHRLGPPMPSVAELAKTIRRTKSR